MKKCKKDAITHVSGVTFKIVVPAEDVSKVDASPEQVVWLAVAPQSLNHPQPKLWDGGKGRVIAVTKKTW